MNYLVILVCILFTLGCEAQSTIESSFKDLDRALTQERYSNIDGVLISKNDSILYESYFNEFDVDQLHDTRSAFKSITGLLAGIAVDQGLISIDDRIGKYITEWKNELRGQITIKHLLEMRSGLACEGFFDLGPDCESEMFESDDWLGYIMDIPLRHRPGKKWEYTSMEPDLVGIIIARASEMNIMAFAGKYLFGPLGIEDYEWLITPDGRGYCAGSFWMRPRDMLKIAQLVQRKGKWEEKQIISEKWIDEMTTCTIDVDMSFLYWSGIENAKTSSARYGYLIYRELLEYQDIKTEVLFASGNGGQYMMILEDYDLAIAFTGSSYGNWKSKLPFELLVKEIIPKVRDWKD